MAEIAIMGRTPFHLVATMARDARESARRRGDAIQFSDIRCAAEKAAQFNGRIFQALQPPKKQRAEGGAAGRRREVILPDRPSAASPDSVALNAPLSERGCRLKSGLRVAEAAQASVLA
jgi:hypothetical protein